MPRTLDISKINSVSKLNKVFWQTYTDKMWKTWIKHLSYPVSQDDLDKVCLLSRKAKSKVKLNNSMGELYLCTEN